MKSGRIYLIFSALLLIFLIPIPTHATPDVGILRTTLANGLQVIIVKNTLAPVVTTELTYLVGSDESPDDFPGMAHAQEHMMFRGSRGLSAAQLANTMALMGGDFNANTQQMVTQYFFTVPDDDLDTALHIESVRMQDVLDTQELWEQERGAIEQEVAQDLSSPEYVLAMRLLAELFANTPYAHDALGTRPSFQKTTAAMLKQFHDTWYAPNNAILVIVGNVDPQKTLARIKELFELIPRRSIPARQEIHLEALKPKPDLITLETDMPTGLAVVAYRLPGYDSPDFAAGAILADVLDSKRGDLYSLVPAGKTLYTGFDGSVLPKAGYGYAFAGFPQGGNGAAIVAAIKEIIAHYVKNGVPAELVEAAKRHEIADAEFDKNSVSGLAAAWSQAVAVENRDSPDDDIEAIRKVSADDVNRVAQKYLVNDTAVTAMLIPRESGTPVATKGFGGKESFAPRETAHVELPAWAIPAAALPPVPTSKVNPIVTKLTNGIRLIVQQETISPTISVYGQIRSNANLETPEGKDGIDGILDNLFSYGTTSLDRLEFQKAQDDIAADISAGTSFSLRVLADHFDRGMELLSDNILHPALPENAFTVVKRETVSSLVGQLKSPGHLSRRALREALYPKGDPELRQPTPETVEKVTLADVRSYYAKVFRPDMTTIVIVGQVTPELAKKTVEKYFSSWQATGPKPQTDYPVVPKNKPAELTVPDLSRVQDEVTLMETLEITRSHPDYYKLQLGNHVLSGAFYASRLYHDLREKSGLVYTVDSFIDAGKTRSLFGVTFACDPPSVSKARAMIERDLRAMQISSVSSEELKQAQMLLLHQIPLSEASMDSIAEGLLARANDDLPLNEPVIAAKQYRVMTAEEVREAFARWIRPSEFVQITVGSKPQ